MSSRNKGHIPKELLENLYSKKRLLFKEIAKRTNRTGKSVCNDLRFHRIPKRGRARRIPKNVLEKLYVTKRLSLKKISDKFDRTIESIRHDLIFYGIPRRKWRGGGRGRGSWPPRLSKETLENLYVKRKMSSLEIAEKTNRGKHGILIALGFHGIQMRTVSAAHRLAISKGRTPSIEGEKNPMWRGGISFELYSPEFNEKLKEKIRRRDEYICQRCGKTQEQELNELNKKLAIHHIDHDKQNCNPSNLITLCASCNSKTNFSELRTISEVVENTRLISECLG